MSAAPAVLDNTMENRGRNFEKLISDIESTFAGSSAQVTRNERLPDLETGKMREIDICIRANIGSMELLTIVECRDRKQKADVTWIEQLDGKRQSVGAHKVVAVSRSGFTEEAVQKAKLRNIETRTLKKLKKSQIREWMNSITAFHFHWSSLGGKIVCSCKDDAKRQEIECLEWFDDRGMPLHVFIREEDAVVMTVLELFSWLYASKNGVIPQAGTEECSQERWIDMDFTTNKVSVLGRVSRHQVTKVNLGFEIFKKQIPIESIEQYKAGDNDLAHQLLWKDDIGQGQSLPLEIEVTLKNI